MLKLSKRNEMKHKLEQKQQSSYCYEIKYKTQHEAL